MAIGGVSLSGSGAFAHIVRSDGAAVAAWGPFVLRSAFQDIFTFGVSGKLAVSAAEGLLRPFRDGAPVAPPAFFAAVPPQDRADVEALARTIHILNAGARLPASAALFVNFNPALFTDAEAIARALEDTRRALRAAPLAPARLVCEVTEQKSGSEAQLFDFVQAMRGLGCRVAVDDFGADSSDIERIDRLRPDIVKFDAAWVAWLMRSDPGEKLLSDMVGRFSRAGIDTLFEGIETRDQLDIAHATGVRMVQGYVLGKPSLLTDERD